MKRLIATSAALVMTLSLLPAMAAASTHELLPTADTSTAADYVPTLDDFDPLPLHPGPARPELTDLGVVARGSRIALTPDSRGRKLPVRVPGKGVRHFDVVTYVVPMTGAECAEAVRIDPGYFPDPGACTGRYAAMASFDEPVSAVEKAAMGIESHSTVWLKTWWHRDCGSLGCASWSNTHEGATYWDYHETWMSNYRGYNSGFHSCNTTSGFLWTISPVNFWETGDPSTWKTRHYDKFTVSFAVNGAPVCITHTMWADVYIHGAFITG